MSCRTPLPIYSKKYMDFDTMVEHSTLSPLHFHQRIKLLYQRIFTSILDLSNRIGIQINEISITMFKTELLNELKTEQ